VITRERPVDLLAPDALADPYPIFAALRETRPVHFSETHNCWLITRYDDVKRAFHDHDNLSSDRITPFLNERLSPDRRPVLEVFSRWLVFRDPPDHGRLRKLVHLAFTPRAVERMHEQIQTIVDELLDALPPHGAIDAVRDFAYPLPAIVIAQMLGAPPGDRDRFKAWSDDITPLLFGGAETADRYPRAAAGVEGFTTYVRALIQRSRHNGKDTLLDDLVRASEDGESLSDAELEATCLLLLFAGHETTTNLIANTLMVLLQHDDARRAVVEDDVAAAGAVEEVLRYEGPAKSIMRWVARDHELHGQTLRRDDRVLLVMGSANRDPERFADPDRFDVRRDQNQHLGFGHGPHYCLGASLARREAQIAVAGILRRLPELRSTTQEREWQPQLLSRGLRSLPLAY